MNTASLSILVIDENRIRAALRPEFLDVPAALLLPTLRGRLVIGGGQTIAVDDFFLPSSRAAAGASTGISNAGINNAGINKVSA